MIEYSCEKIEKILRKLLHHLMSLNIISAPECNKIVQQRKSTKSNADKFTQFSTSNDSLDYLLFFSIEISTSLLAAFKSVPTKYEEAKRRMKKD